MNLTYGHCPYGVDYSIPPYEMPLGVLADASNVVPSDEGLPTGRNGSVKYNNTSLASAVTSFYEYRYGTTVNSICSYSTKVAVYNTTTSEFVDKITGLTNGAMFQWANFEGKAIGVNGADTPQYWTDDTHNGDLTGAPAAATCVCEWSNRVWFASGATLTACAINNPTDYSTSGADGYISQIVGDSGDAITGIYGFFDVLLVGKKNTIYKVYFGTPNDATSLYIVPLYMKSADSVGFTSRWAITQVGNDILFLDGSDIKRLAGIQEYGDIETTSIIPHFRDYLESVADVDYLQYSQFFHYKKKQQVWCSIPTGASTRYVFVLDYRFKDRTGRYSFYPMSGLTVNCFGGVQDGSTTDIYYGDRTGYVYHLDTGNNDNGSAITRYFTHCISGNALTDPNNNAITNVHNYRKNFIYSDTYIKPTETVLAMTPSYALDIMDDAQVRTSGNYTALSAETVSGWTGTGIKTKRFRFYGLNGRTMCLKWTHNTVNQNFVFYPSNIYFTAKSRVIIE